LQNEIGARLCEVSALAADKKTLDDETNTLTGQISDIQPTINSINANLRLLGITGFEIICHDAEMKLYRYLSLATLSAASNRSERATLPLYITSFTDIPVNACINNNLFFTGFVRNLRSATNGGRRYKFAKAPTLTHIFLIKHHRLTAYN